jgi:signal transduction histidine kinase
VRAPAQSWKAFPPAIAGAAFLASAVLFGAMAALVPLREETLLVIFWCLLWAVAVGFAAQRFGPVFGAPFAVTAALAIDSFYIAPTRSFSSNDWQNYLITAMYIAIGVLVGVVLEAARRRAEISERVRGRLGEEQAALRRVATAVAQGVPAEDLFAVVATEVGRVTPAADVALIGRYRSGDQVEFVSGWGKERAPDLIAEQVPLGGVNVTTLVFERGEPARVDELPQQAGPMSILARKWAHASVGAPISVEGRLWGVMIVGSRRKDGLPPGLEHQLADFTDLLVTAIANAEARAELTASRARIVLTADETRRRIERDLHDGVQQRLVSLALELRIARRRVPENEPGVGRTLTAAADALGDLNDEVREIAQGIHPAILTQGGLAPALRTLARRCPVLVEIELDSEERLPEQIEVTAYYVVAEALTNAAKHAGASRVSVAVAREDGSLRLAIGDDGVGGADPVGGSGLTGIRDRAEALGGSLAVHSPRGDGTALEVALPLVAPTGLAGFSG